MKVGKDGRLKLSKDERQVGNFIWKDEPDHIKICDINSQVTHRISKSLNIGRMMEIAFKDKEQKKGLENYATMLWNFSNMVPDVEFMKDIDAACLACVNRNKEFFGITEDISAESDAEILQEQREIAEALEELKEKE